MASKKVAALVSLEAAKLAEERRSLGERYMGGLIRAQENVPLQRVLGGAAGGYAGARLTDLAAGAAGAKNTKLRTALAGAGGLAGAAGFGALAGSQARERGEARRDFDKKNPGHQVARMLDERESRALIGGKTYKAELDRLKAEHKAKTKS